MVTSPRRHPSPMPKSDSPTQSARNPPAKRKAPASSASTQNNKDMSSAQGYAARLSPYDEKGHLNLQSEPDPAPALLAKARHLAGLIRSAKHVVVHTGAGISTAAGIRDFRGPDGVWTRAGDVARNGKEGGKKDANFEDAVPTLTHVAITMLHKAGLVQYVVSQNVDGLHGRSGLPRAGLSELHGNLFVDWCKGCGTEFARDGEAETVGLRANGRRCGKCGAGLTDKALDWEDELPEVDLDRARRECKRADLHVVVGTSCQMVPARMLPFCGRGKVGMVNLSRTEFDGRCGVVVRGCCDVVFGILVRELDVGLGVFERRIRLVMWAVGAGDGVRCGVDTVWDGRRMGRMVVGVAGVRFRTEGGTWVSGVGKGYLGQVGIAEKVEVEVVGEGGVKRVMCEVGGTVEIEVCAVRRDYGEKVGEIVIEIEEDARRWRKRRRLVDEVEKWFVKGGKRGWYECVICEQAVWSGKGKRAAHIEKCVER